jgi:hypothetical protein
VLVRHEQAASFMAEIYGRLTGRAGVCSTTLGPGAINLLPGTADATTNSSPMVALSAQVGLNRIYKESHQSVDLVSMFAPVTKWADAVLTPAAVPEMIRKGFKLAQTERPGAVYLAVPEDVETMNATGLAPLNVNLPRPNVPSAAQIERAAAVLDAARRPIVLAGHGAARADAAGALRRFSEQLGLPVATTFHGKGVFPDDHPHALGAVGFMRHDYVDFGFDESDVIISVGYELQEFDPARINPGRDKRILHLSRFPAEVDASYDVEIGVQADLSATLDALAAATSRRWQPGASGEKIRALLAGELDHKDEWLAARLEDLDYGDIDGICAAARVYPLTGIKKDELDTALGYFENNAPACATTGSAPAACSPAPASLNPSASRSSGSASNRQACTGPPPAQTPSPRCAASRPAAQKTASGTHCTTRHRQLDQPNQLNDLDHLQIDAHPTRTSARTTTNGKPPSAARSPTTSARSKPSASTSPSPVPPPNPARTDQETPRPPDP